MGTPSEPVVDEVAQVKDAAKGDAPSVKTPYPVDTVLAVSRLADGTPRQSAGFKSVDPEATAAISEQQLRQIAVSAVDHEMRGALAASGDLSGEVSMDPVVKALKDAHDKASEAGAKYAASEKVEGV